MIHQNSHRVTPLIGRTIRGRPLTVHCRILASYRDRYVQLLKAACGGNAERTPYQGFPQGWVRRLRMILMRRFQHVPGFHQLRAETFVHVHRLGLEGMLGRGRSQTGMPAGGPLWERFEQGVMEIAAQQDGLSYRTFLLTASRRP